MVDENGFSQMAYQVKKSQLQGDSSTESGVEGKGVTARWDRLWAAAVACHVARCRGGRLLQLEFRCRPPSLLLERRFPADLAETAL